MSFDIKEVQRQFNEVIKFSQNYNFEPKTDDLFEKWYEAKRFFIDKMGGLIWEAPEKVCFPLDPATRKTKLTDFINTNVLYYYSNYDLAKFLTDEAEGFFDNVVTDEYKTSSGEIIPKGMKIIKAFRYFIEDKTTLDLLQTKASMLIQENKIEGTFCISVHPLDFISASENQYHWHSCHALDGEYRAGNLSYMCDKTTVMCYIKGDDNVVLPNFPKSIPWNNKKWRMWLYLADEHNALMAGRQYPFTINDILNYVRTQFFSIVNYHDYRWTQWHNEFISSFEFHDDTHERVNMNQAVPMGGYFQPLTKAVTDNSKLHYNDLLYSSYYTPYYCWRQDTQELVHFSVGSQVKCLKCGDGLLTCPDTMVGSCCWSTGYYDSSDDYDYCSVCGERHHVDDMYWVGDDHLCWDCYSNECVECSRCGEAMYESDAYWADDQPYCRYCYNRLVAQRTEMDANV